jgi:hypothetical protein
MLLEGVVAAWLCGNAYEEVVIVPNFVLGDVGAAMVAFRAFFHVSNPAFFYVPLGPLVVVTAIVNVATSWRDPARRPSALRAGLCVLVAVLLTAWIVVHVNLRLFFGPVRTDLVEARSLAWQWLALNAIRMGLLGITIVSLRRAARG